MLGATQEDNELDEVVSLRPSAPAKPSPPVWVEAILGPTFFTPCVVHAGMNKNDCNFFCLTCTPATGRAMCKFCLPGHAVCCTADRIQVRHYMYQDVVHVEDVVHRHNIEGVQSYCINQRRAMLLHKKAPPPTAGTTPSFENRCRGCAVPLNPAFRYCCLKCKIDLEYGVEPGTPGPNRTSLAPARPSAPTTVTPGAGVFAFPGVGESELRSSVALGATFTTPCSTIGSKRRKIDRPVRSHLM